jgi:hypothetical protein
MGGGAWTRQGQDCDQYGVAKIWCCQSWQTKPGWVRVEGG